MQRVEVTALQETLQKKLRA